MQEEGAEEAAVVQTPSSAQLPEPVVAEAPLLPRRRRLRQEEEEGLHLQEQGVVGRPIDGVSPLPDAANEHAQLETSAAGSDSAGA